MHRDYLKKKVKEGCKVSRDRFIISGFKPEDIEMVSITDAGVVTERPNFNTYGASVNKIQMCLFGEPRTINKDVYEKMRQETDIKTISREYGDSVEKTLWINYLIKKVDGQD